MKTGEQRKNPKPPYEEGLFLSRDMAQRYLDIAGVMIVVINTDQRVVMVNKTGCKILGYSQEEIIGKDWFDHFFPHEVRDSVKSVFTKMIAGQDAGSGYFENPILTKTAEKRVIAWHNTPIKNAEGDILAVLSSGEDVTERKRMEDALKKTRDRLELRVVERTSELNRMNEQLRREVSERSEAEKRLKISYALLRLQGNIFSRAEYLAIVVKLIRGLIGCQCVGIRLLNDRGEIPYESYLGFSREFWKKENCLSIKKDQCICTRVMTQKPLPVDRRAMTPGGSFYSNNTFQFIASLSKKEKRNFRGVCVEHGFVSLAVIPIRYKDQAIALIHLADKKKGVMAPEKIQLVESLALIIGESINRFNLLARIQNANELLERMFTSTNFSIAYLGRDFNFIRVNQRYAQADGRTPDFFVGKNYFDLFPDRDNELIFRKVVETGEPYSVTMKSSADALHSERGITYWDWSLHPVKNETGTVEGLIFYLVDVTQRKRAEEELANAQKELANAKRLSDIGVLAATVAHELRNPLGAMRLAAYNIKTKDPNRSLKMHIEHIEQKIQESDQIINNLLFYSRIKMPQYERVRLCDILKECVENAKEQFRDSSTVVIRKYQGIKRDFIDVDVLQVKEVFINILNNAFEALEGVKKGRIEVIAHHDRKTNEMRIGFKDNGAGIDPHILNRISEPFFTTKAKGTGLGLTVCYQIVSLHGGKIDIESGKRRGTIFTVTLPITHRL